MFSAHSEGARLGESWHSSKCVWVELGNLGQEEVRHGGLRSNGRVRVGWIQASDLLHNVLSDCATGSNVPGCSQGTS